MHRIDDAVAQFTHVAKENPRDPSTHYHLGILYKRKFMRDAAIGELMRAHQLDPDDEATIEELSSLQQK
jgi:Flp pilus assembly protein TadD